MTSFHQALAELKQRRSDGPAIVYPEPAPEVDMTATELLDYLDSDSAHQEEYRLTAGERKLLRDALIKAAVA